MRYFRRSQLDAIDLEAGDHLKNEYPVGFTKVKIKSGKSGPWKVETFTLTRRQVGLDNLRLIRDGQLRRVVPPGKYTRLMCGGAVVMSDTPAEAHEHHDFWIRAKGSVLIAGLGLGFSLQAILTKPSVKRVLVVEKSADVIKLVKPSIIDPRVTIVRRDIFTWRPDKGDKFDVAWFDIWSTIGGDGVEDQMKMLRMKRFASWNACWSEEYL